MIDGKEALKLQARDERRRTRAQEKQRERELKRVKSAQKIRARAQAYRERYESTVTPGKRRRGVTSVFYTNNGISKFHPYSTRDMIMRYMRSNLQPGEPITVDELSKKCEDFLYGESIRRHLYKLEEAAHIEFVFKE